jgi:hypothetical protein
MNKTQLNQQLKRFNKIYGDLWSMNINANDIIDKLIRTNVELYEQKRAKPDQSKDIQVNISVKIVRILNFNYFNFKNRKA